ncbi:MAG: hypothetical protein ACAH11_09745 [Sphingomonas sp.]
MAIGVFEMVVGVVLIGTIGSVIKARMGVRKDQWGNETIVHADPAGKDENDRLRREVGSLKERIQVLERVITDDESNSKRLDREIERLRDKNSV